MDVLLMDLSIYLWRFNIYLIIGAYNTKTAPYFVHWKLKLPILHLDSVQTH